MTNVLAKQNFSIFANKNIKPTPKILEPRISELHVEGNVLKNEQGQTIILRGVNRSGAEYMCVQGRGFMDGPTDDSTILAMKSWRINAVRIPLNEHCWLGLSDVKEEYSGEKYRLFIKDYVKRLIDNNIYVIVDLHWSGPELRKTSNQAMPNAKYAVSFWESAANEFKDNRKVLLDVINETFPDKNRGSDAAWKCWKEGGKCPGVSYDTVGMQTLVNTVRQTGAENIILLGGIRYANDLSKWLEYKPVDPLNNLAASWHIYPNGNPCNTTACYDRMIAPVAEKVPLIAGEFGESVKGDVCSVEKTNEVLDWLDKHKVSYLIWTWNTWSWDCGNWSLIYNFDGTPKSPNGTNYKEHLSAINN